MAQPVRRPPGPADEKNPRGQEYFNHEVYRTLALVGTATVDVGSISAGAIATFTITVSGALADMQQTVQLAPPSAIESGLVWCGFVSADDTVTVRIHNTTGGAVNPVSATWGARVML
jgi:hypothetical protein